jgi:hypothetical protein
MSRKPAALWAVAFAVALLAVLGTIEAEFWRGFWTGIALVLTPSLTVLAYLLWAAEDER